jgi:hypothetical protein
MATFESGGFVYRGEGGSAARWTVLSYDGANVGSVSSRTARQLRTGTPLVRPPVAKGHGFFRIGDFRRKGKGDNAPFRGKPLDWDRTVGRLLSLVKKLRGRGKYFMLRIGANWKTLSPKLVQQPDGSYREVGESGGPGVREADGDNQVKEHNLTSLQEALLESQSWEDFTTRLLHGEDGMLQASQPFVYAIDGRGQDTQPGKRR